MSTSPVNLCTNILPWLMMGACINSPTGCAGWFDLYRVDRLLQGDVDHEGVRAAVGYLDGLVEAESKEVPASRIVVGGFSQVGVFPYLIPPSHSYLFLPSHPLLLIQQPIQHVCAAGRACRHQACLVDKACFAGLRGSEQLDGGNTWRGRYGALSCCASQPEWSSSASHGYGMSQVAEHAKARSYFVGHGTADPLIPAALATATVALLKDKGISLLAYPGFDVLQDCRDAG